MTGDIEQNIDTRIDEFSNQSFWMILRNLSEFIYSLAEEERQIHIGKIDVIRLALLSHIQGIGFNMRPDDVDYYPRLLDEATQILMEFE